MILARDGQIISDGGQFKTGDCSSCCGGSGSPGTCGCATDSGWYRTDCSGRLVLAFQAAFTPAAPYPIDFTDGSFQHRTIGVAEFCAIRRHDPQFNTIYPIEQQPAIEGTTTFTTTPFHRLQTNSDGGCTQLYRYESVTGTYPESLLGRRPALASLRASPYDTSTGLARFSLGVADVCYSKGVITVSFQRIGTSGVRVTAIWDVTFNRIKYQTTFDGGPFGPVYVFGNQGGGCSLFLQTRILTNAELCEADEITLTDGRGGTCVISKYAGDMPTRYTACARCYDVTFEEETTEFNNHSPVQCFVNTGHVSKTFRFAKVVAPDPNFYDNAAYFCITPGYTGSLLPSQDGRWFAGVTNNVPGTESYGGVIGMSDTGECPSSRFVASTQSRVTAISAASCSEGELGPCTAFEDCYQLSNDSTIVIDRGGSFSLHFNDNSFGDNPAVTLEASVYINAVLTYTGVEVPNDTPDGIVVGNVSTGDTVRVVWTGGYFDYGVAPMNAEGYFLSGDPAFPYEATDDFVCPGLLTWTLVGKVTSP